MRALRERSSVVLDPRLALNQRRTKFVEKHVVSRSGAVSCYASSTRQTNVKTCLAVQWSRQSAWS